MLWTSHTFYIPLLPIIIIIMYSSYSFISHHQKYVLYYISLYIFYINIYIYTSLCCTHNFLLKKFSSCGPFKFNMYISVCVYVQTEAKIRYFVRRIFYQNIVQFSFKFSFSSHSLAPLSSCTIIFLQKFLEKLLKFQNFHSVNKNFILHFYVYALFTLLYIGSKIKFFFCVCLTILYKFLFKFHLSTLGYTVYYTINMDFYQKKQIQVLIIENLSDTFFIGSFRHSFHCNYTRQYIFILNIVIESVLYLCCHFKRDLKKTFETFILLYIS